jgi:hypothetical protein
MWSSISEAASAPEAELPWACPFGGAECTRRMAFQASETRGVAILEALFAGAKGQCISSRS